MKGPTILSKDVMDSAGMHSTVPNGKRALRNGFLLACQELAFVTAGAISSRTRQDLLL